MSFITVLTPIPEIARQIEVLARADDGPLATAGGKVDDAIRHIGDQVIAHAIATISHVANGATQGQKNEVYGTDKDPGLISRIGWAKKPIESRPFRLGLVVSGHPSSVRWEFGTGNKYPATKFFSGAGLSVAADTAGAKFKANERRVART